LSIEKFATSMGCKKLLAYQPINASRAFELASSLGFVESYRCIVKGLEA
jgi:hypothetical protein